jgi:lactate permease
MLMSWIQNYNPLGNLGISALVAAIPLFILL